MRPFLYLILWSNALSFHWKQYHDAHVDINVIITVTNLLDLFIQQPNATRGYVEKFWPVAIKVNIYCK